MAVNIGPRIGIDGEAEYRKQIQNIIQSTKTLKSEMQALETQTTKSKNPFVQLGNEMTKNAEKRKLLSAAIDEQKAKLADLSTMQSAAVKKFGESSTQAQKWQQAVADAETELNKLNAELESTPKRLETMGSAFQSAGDKIASVGKSMTTYVTLPIAGAFATSLNAYKDWESAFTGVMKTVDETATTTYADLEEAIKKMATETASSKEEIAGVAEVAGQLGISADDIEKFTKTMVMLGDSTNLSSEEAATSLARIINITGESTDNIDRLGASVVALGNNFATDEASIVEMSNRLASAGTIAGMSTQDILAMATAMSSVGIQAEAGGTAMTQTLTGISQAVSEGGAKLDQLAQVAGMDAETFSNAWKSSPIDALQAFISGLSQMNEAELDTYSVLDELGMSGIRQSNMLQSLALASDTLSSAVETSNAAYNENTALVDEASKRYETFEAKLSQTKEKLSNVGVELGERLLPYVDKFLDGVDKLVQAWDNLSPGAQDAIVKIGLIVAAIGPLLTVVGNLMSSVGSIMIYGPFIAETLGVVGTAITTTVLPALGSMAVAAATAIAPFLPFIAIGAAVVGAGVLIYKNWGTIKEKAGELKNAVSEKWQSLKEDTANKFEEIKTDASEKWQSISEGINNKVDSAKQTISNKWNELRNNTNNAWSNIKNSVDQHGGGIKGIIGAYGDWYVSKWRNAFDSINQATGGKLAEAANIVRNKLGEIQNIFTNLGSQAASWGRDLISNFVNGILSNIGRIAGAASNVAGTVRKYIHFSEPDVGPLSDFSTYAPDMMKQFAQGIEANVGMVEDAMSTFSGAVAQSMGANTYTSSVGAVNIIINAAEGQSVEDLADLVQERINRDVMLSARSMA